MTAPDLSDAHVKLARAHNHIADIESQIRSFLSTDFYRIRLEPNEREGRIKIILDSLHNPDKTINALIGDAIGNLRSVLDYAVVALASPFTGRTAGSAFPFADNAEGFAGEVASSRCLGPCDAAVRQFFVDKVQAYQGGKGHAFWVLNKLRNIDKHRLLLSATQLAGVTASFRDRDGNVFTDFGMNITAGESCVFIDAPMNHIEFTDQPRAAFDILLKEPPFIEAPVGFVLKTLSKETKRFLDAL
jgi:hypothetical protein